MIKPSLLVAVQSLGIDNNLDIGSTLSKPMTVEAIASALNPYLRKSATPEHQTKIISELVPFDYGFSLLYEPELRLENPIESVAQRIRAHPQWHMDNDDMLSGYPLNALARDCGMSKGLSKLTLIQCLQNMKLWAARGFLPDISIELSESFLTDLSTPDSLAMLADRLAVRRERLAIEIHQNSILHTHEPLSDVLSRLRIKGFKIDVVVEGEGEDILPLVDNLPIDQIVVDMTPLIDTAGFLNNMEIEFRYSSFTSVMAKKGIVTCAANVNSLELFNFARKCRFNGTRGLHISPPTKAASILSLCKDGVFSRES